MQKSVPIEEHNYYSGACQRIIAKKSVPIKEHNQYAATRLVNNGS